MPYVRTVNGVEMLADNDPILNPPPTWDDIRLKRDNLIASFAWRVERFNDETTLAITVTDANASYTAFSGMSHTGKIALLWYIQDLRDITSNYATPALVVWPTEPV